MSDEPSSLEEIKQLLRQGQKIAAIKALREDTGMGLKESKEQVEAIQAKMIADGEELPKTSGCMGAILLMVSTAGTLGWMFFA